MDPLGVQVPSDSFAKDSRHSVEGRRSKEARRSYDGRRSYEGRRSLDVNSSRYSYARRSGDLTRAVIDEHSAAVEADDEGDHEQGEKLNRPRSTNKKRKGKSPTRSPRQSMNRPRSPFMPDGTALPASPFIGKRSSSLQLDRDSLNIDALMSDPASQSSASHYRFLGPGPEPPLPSASSLKTNSTAPQGSAHAHKSSTSTAAPSFIEMQASPSMNSSVLKGKGSSPSLASGKMASSATINSAKTGASSFLLNVPQTDYYGHSRRISDGQSFFAIPEDSSTYFGRKSMGDDTADTPRVSMMESRPTARSLDLFNSAARSKLDAFDANNAQSLYAHPHLPAHNTRAEGAEENYASLGRGASMDMRRSSIDTFTSANSRMRISMDQRYAGRHNGRIATESSYNLRGASMDFKRSLDVGRSFDLRQSRDLGRSIDMSRPSMTNFGRTSVALSHRPSGLGDRPVGMSADDTSFVMLERITSEPIRGGPFVTAPFGAPLRYHYAEMPIENIADMKAAVAQIGSLLEERRQRGVAASKAKDGRFWLAFMGIAVTGFLSATDMTIIAPILPTIAADLTGSDISPTWITSAFLLTMTAFQPLWGGVSDAVGRRPALAASLIVFLVGSIPCTIAQDMLTMVVGRGLQGVGGGGMLAVGEVMLSDMTTLAERGYFLGLLSMAFAVAAIAAPLVGGVFATAGGLGWRWSFLINFPIGVVALLLVFTANHLRIPQLTWRQKIARCDAPSALILFGATLSLLIGLTRGGVEYEWTDGVNVILPLACGGLGYAIFLAVQWWPYKNYLAPRPVMSRVLFFDSGRTAAIAFILTFLHGIMLYGAVQTLIIYFETRNATPIKAAINVLPANAPSTPAAFVAGIIMAITGRYKGMIIGSEALMLIGFGLFIYLDQDSPTYQWVIFQFIASLGIGAMYTLALPPIQASVPPAFLARATATFAFVRSLGAVWGVSTTLIAFSSQAGTRLAKVPGATEAGITGRTAINSTTVVKTLAEPLQSAVRAALDHGLRISFAVLVPFGFIGLILSIFIRHVPLPDFNSSEFGLEQQQAQQSRSKSKSKHEEIEMSPSEKTDSPRSRHHSGFDSVDLEKGGALHSDNIAAASTMRSMDISRTPRTSNNLGAAEPRPSVSGSYMGSLRRSNSFWS